MFLTFWDFSMLQNQLKKILFSLRTCFLGFSYDFVIRFRPIMSLGVLINIVLIKRKLCSNTCHTQPTNSY